MRRHTDTETLSLLAALERDDEAPPRPSPECEKREVPPAVPPPPEVKPPSNFRELVAQRQEAFHAGQRPVWLEE